MKFSNLFKKEPKKSLTSIVEKLVAEHFGDYVGEMLNDPKNGLKITVLPYPSRTTIISTVDLEDLQSYFNEISVLKGFTPEIKKIQLKIEEIESESFIDEVVDRINRKRVNATP